MAKNKANSSFHAMNRTRTSPVKTELKNMHRIKTYGQNKTIYFKKLVCVCMYVSVLKKFGLAFEQSEKSCEQSE